VPGPLIYLYNDPSVPLYNYVTTNRSYSNLLPADTTKWRTISQADHLFAIDSSSETFNLQITNQIDQPAYTYAVSIPLGLSVSTRITPTMVTKQTITIEIKNIRISVFYNSELVNSPYIGTVQDASMITMKATITGLSGETLSLTQYVGNAYFPRIPLYTQSGYVYTVRLQASVSAYLGVLSITTGDFLFDNANLISNVSQTPNTTTKCSLTSIAPVSLGNTGFVFTDVLV
jgi:hypothetical protein